MGMLVIAFANASPGPAAAPDNPPRLDRTDLLVYRTRSGEAAPVKTKGQWEKRRAEIIRGMMTITGPLPGKAKRCPLDVQVKTETDRGSYVCRDITYASEPGSRVPAFLLIPKNTVDSRAKVPAILALHPTDMDYGRRVVVEELRTHYRAYARDLAERGFVVLAPAYPIMADYQPDLKALGYQSGTMKAVWDNIRGLDLLDSLPFVKGKRFGAIGHSLGGHNAIYTAVFDDRIVALVSSCGFDSFTDYMGGNITGWTSTRYMPKLLDYRHHLADIPFDFHELLGALAPRPVFINAPLGDTNFKSDSVDRVVQSASAVYRLYGKPDRITLLHPDCSHDFPPDVRQQAYEFLEKCLR
jgi:dienelactone hydrolase